MQGVTLGCSLPSWSSQDWGARCRAADELQPDDLEDSVAEWLVAQRAAWQAGRLDLEQRLLLQMAGIRSRVSPCCDCIIWERISMTSTAGYHWLLQGIVPSHPQPCCSWSSCCLQSLRSHLQPQSGMRLQPFDRGVTTW